MAKSWFGSSGKKSKVSATQRAIKIENKIKAIEKKRAAKSRLESAKNKLAKLRAKG